uniref:Anaphase-promoting complex subunit 4 WD40 domain-containing protein n=1 Tax=Trieres chinensis TaxID=1514140 RepID=A0A7S2EMB9_TRICV
MSSTDDMDAAIPTIMLSPTTAPSSQLTKKDGVKSSKSWRVIGNAIHGLQNESGMIISISSAGINWGYSEEKSNFTFSGFAVAVSSDGNVLAVGEPGTETVRTFNKHGDNWIQRGDILKGERLCENKIHEGGVRNLRNVEMNMEGHEPKFLPCYSAFGFDVDISGDGNTLAVGAIGYNDERGLLRTFEWDGTEWAQVGDDLQGDAIYDGFGGTVSVSDDGLTIAATSPQSIHPGFAKSLGISPFYGRGYGKVFDRIGKKWIQRGGTLRGNNSTDGMAAISMTGTGKMIALGTILGGYVEVFYWDEDARKWAPKGGLLDAPLGEADFGMPLALSKNGEILAVAADYKGDGVTTTDGYLIYVFEWDVASNSWNRRDRLVGLEAQAGRGFSISVSADGSVLGAAFGNGIQMYKWNEDSYYLIGSFGGYGRADLDLSDDGRTVAVGWPEDMSAGFGLGRTSVLRQERDLR